MNRPAILEALPGCVPDLLTVYAFGSRMQGTAGPQSDLDLAVRVRPPSPWMSRVRMRPS